MPFITRLLFLNVGGAEFILLLIPLSLTIFCLVNIIKSRFEEGITKQIWILIVILMPIVGSLLYLVLGKKQHVR